MSVDTGRETVHHNFNYDGEGQNVLQSGEKGEFDEWHKLIVHAYDWQIIDGEISEEKTELRAWCLDRNSKPHLVRILDFPTFAYLELPKYVDGRPITWNRQRAKKVFDYLQFCLKTWCPQGYLLEEAVKLYFLQEGSTPFMLISFNNLKAMRKCRDFVSRPRYIRGIGRCVKLSLHETKVSQVRKLLTKCDCGFSKWFEVRGQPASENERVSINTVKEYIVDHRTIKQLNCDWVTNPGILSVDIEAYSNNIRAFPDPWNSRDIAHMISCIYRRSGITREDIERYTLKRNVAPKRNGNEGSEVEQNEVERNEVEVEVEVEQNEVERNEVEVEVEQNEVKRNVATQDKPEHEEDQKAGIRKLIEDGYRERNICIIYGVCGPPNKGDEFIFVNSETELIRKFEEIVGELDPEIITGYNIHGFDYPYLDKRLRRQGLKWGVLGRIKDEKAILKSSNWQSSGFGHNDINILQMSGRISVDLLPLIRREHKLPKYNLDTVANHFLGKGKNPVTAQHMFVVVKYMLVLSDILEYMRPNRDKMYGLSEFERDRIFFRLQNAKNIINWATERNEKNKELNKKLSKAELNQLIDLVNYVDEQIKIIADYCLRDSEVVIELCDKLNIWIFLIQLSSITGVTPMELFTRGQQARGLSAVYDLASRKGYVIDSRVYEKESFTGGFVWDPVPGLYDLVICLDFKSLYPSIIMAYNICWTTYVPPWLDHVVPDEKCNVIAWIDKTVLAKKTRGKEKEYEKCKDFDQEENGKIKYKLINRRFRFIKAEFKKGILPQLVKKLIDERNKIKDAMKHEKDPIKLIIMEQRQLGLKQTANSMYGLLGVTGEGAVLPLPAAAMSVTAYGRQLILECNDYVVDKYDAQVVYNDSVTADTPILVRPVRKGIIGGAMWARIDQLSPYNSKSNKIRVDMTSEDGYEVWSDQGWTDIKQVISHWTNKQIYRITTAGGTIDVTEDHSLLDPNGKEVRPAELKVGDQLLHHDLPDISTDKPPLERIIFKTRDKLEAADTYHSARQIGYQVKLKVVNDIFQLVLTEEKASSSMAIKKIELLSDGKEGQYVYDLETANHHFSAGIGCLVVHNTDSTMIKMPGVKIGPEAITCGKKLETEISAIFPDPLYLEFEKAGRQFCIAKKNYVFWKYDELGNLPYYENGRPQYESKGIPTARRDKAAWQQEIVVIALDMIIERKPHQEFLDMVIERVVLTLREEIPWRDFIIIRGLGAAYKDKTYFMKVYSEELQKLGRPAQPGDRLEYVIVKPLQAEKLLGKRMRDPEIYYERLETEDYEPVDYEYYIEHFLMDCIQKYWQIAYKEIVSKQIEKNQLDNNNKILCELDAQGYGPWVSVALSDNDNDPRRAVDTLLNIQEPMQSIYLNIVTSNPNYCDEILAQLNAQGYDQWVNGALTNNDHNRQRAVNALLTTPLKRKTTTALRRMVKSHPEIYNNILTGLNTQGYGQWVMAAMLSNDNDIERALRALVVTSVKNKVVMARRKHVSGQNIFDYRLNGEPIKTLLKGYRLGRLEEVVRGLASPSMYNRLYSNNEN